ncbi:MAG: hypothetical protein AAFV29_12990, partial [Myxococcota bacterium]
MPGIWHNEDGTYLVRITWIDRRTGKRKKLERTVNTMAEALIIHASRREPAAPPSKESLRNFVTRWARDHLERVEPSTRERYILASARLTLALGDVYVEMITPKDIRNLVDEARADFA